MARGSASRSGAAPQVDGAAIDGTTAQQTPAADTPPEAVLDTQPESRSVEASKVRLAQLAGLTAELEEGRDPIVRDGTPVYPGPMDTALPAPETVPEDAVVDGGGHQLAQVLFNFYRVVRPDGRRITARRGQIFRVTVEDLERGVALGGLRSLE